MAAKVTTDKESKWSREEKGLLHTEQLSDLSTALRVMIPLCDVMRCKWTDTCKSYTTGPYTQEVLSNWESQDCYFFSYLTFDQKFCYPT